MVAHCLEEFVAHAMRGTHVLLQHGTGIPAFDAVSWCLRFAKHEGPNGPGGGSRSPRLRRTTRSTLTSHDCWIVPCPSDPGAMEPIRPVPYVASLLSGPGKKRLFPRALPI